MVYQPSELQKNNSRDLLMFFRNKLSHLLILYHLRVQFKMLLHLLSIEKLQVTLKFKRIGFLIALKIQKILSLMLKRKIIKVVSFLYHRISLIMIKLKQSLIMFLLTLKEVKQLQTIHLMRKLARQYQINPAINKMLIYPD